MAQILGSRSEDHWNNKSDLLVALGTTTAKFAVAGVVAAMIAGSFFVGAGVGAVVLVTILGAVGIGILLDIADNHWHITDSLKKGWNEHVEPNIEEAEDSFVDIFMDFADTVSRGGI